MNFKKYLSQVVDGRKYHYYAARNSDGRSLPGVPFIHDVFDGATWSFRINHDHFETLDQAKAFIRTNFGG